MSLASVIAAESPDVWWPLDETSGTSAADSSGGGHPGTYSGSPTPTLGQDGPSSCLESSLAAHFDRTGTNKEYVHSGTAGVLTGSGEFSMAIWWWPDSAPDYAVLMQQRSWTQVGPIFDVDGLVRMEITNGDAFRVVMSTGTSSVDDQSFSLPSRQQRLNCWHLAVIRRTSAGDVEAIVDGTILGSFTETHALTAVALDVGADGFDINRGVASSLEWERFAGRLAHVQLYQHRISDSFIARQFAVGCPCPGGGDHVGFIRS